MASSERAARLGREIKDLLAELIVKGIKDPRVQSKGLVTITDVALTDDLGSATVYVSVLGGDLEPVVEGLMAARGYLQAQIGKSLRMKSPPRIKIASAERIQQAKKMEILFIEIEKEQAAKAAAAAAEAKAADAAGVPQPVSETAQTTQFTKSDPTKKP